MSDSKTGTRVGTGGPAVDDAYELLVPFGAGVGAGFALPTPRDIEAALCAYGALLQQRSLSRFVRGNLVVCFRDDARRSLVTGSPRTGQTWLDDASRQ